MKKLVNRVQLIGNLGKDVETFETKNGRKVAKVTIATRDVYFTKDGVRVDNTDWHKLVGWGKVGERMEKMGAKGKHVMIGGKLSTRSYEDKEGVKKYVTEIEVDDFMLLSPKAA